MLLTKIILDPQGLHFREDGSPRVTFFVCRTIIVLVISSWELGVVLSLIYVLGLDLCLVEAEDCWVLIGYEFLDRFFVHASIKAVDVPAPDVAFALLKIVIYCPGSSLDHR